jgi:glycerate dehydrogenase
LGTMRLCMRSVFLDYQTVSNGDLDPAALERATDDIEIFPLTSEVEIEERMADAEVVLINKVKLRRARLEAAPRLKLIAIAGTGTDNVDLEAAKECGIGVCNVRGYCTASVVQHTWALVLSLTQHIAGYDRIAIDGTWTRKEEYAVLAFPIRELAGRIFGVIGWGTLGRGAAKVAEAFGMRVMVANRPGEALVPGRVPLDELLGMADVVSLHCPSTPATRGLIGARELALMKPSALLINTARGALIDSLALAAALKAGRLGGAGIDVLSQEPPVDGDPLLDLEIPNLILTPHVAWAARDARQRCIDEMAANIEDFKRGGRRGRVV